MSRSGCEMKIISTEAACSMAKLPTVITTPRSAR